MLLQYVIALYIGLFSLLVMLSVLHVLSKVIALYIGLFSRVHPRNDADGDLVIALYIGLFSHSMQNAKQLEQNAILLLPSISGYFHILFFGKSRLAVT